MVFKENSLKNQNCMPFEQKAVSDFCYNVTENKMANHQREVAYYRLKSINL